MANAVASIDVSPASQPMQPHGVLDEHHGLAEPRYWPTELLATFTLQMAGHGRCVSSAMMLGLREVAVQLFSYFDDARHWARVSVHSA